MHYLKSTDSTSCWKQTVREIALIVGIVIKYSASNLRQKRFFKIISAGLLN